MTAAAVAAVDIGGTKIAAGLVEPDGTVSHRRSESTPGRAGDVITAVVDLVAGLGAGAVGIGSAGVIDPRTGTVLSATDAISGWAGTPLRDEVSARTGRLVAVDNDVRAHTRGEQWLGSARGFGSVLMVAVGTGIGAAYAVDGTPLVGAHGLAGHLGHLPAPGADGVACSCGGTGHLEAVASGPALSRAYAARTGLDLPLTEIAARADAGDATAAAVIVQGAVTTGSVVGGVVNLLDPGIVVLGGGVAGCGARWFDALVDAARAELLPAAAGVEFALSSLGADAALLGAARLAWEVA